MQERSRNLRFISRYLRRGVPYTDLIQIIDAREAYEEKDRLNREKGSLSERIARNAIAKIPEVRSATITPQLSTDDLNLIDVNVYLHEKTLYQHLGVQVKSSQYGINQAMAEFMIEASFDKEQLEEWLLENKLIFVNGSLPHEEIQKQFLAQKAKIKEYYDKKHPPTVEQPPILIELEENIFAEIPDATRMLAERLSAQRLAGLSYSYSRDNDTTTCTATFTTKANELIRVSAKAVSKKASRDSVSAVLIQYLEQRVILPGKQ